MQHDVVLKLFPHAKTLSSYLNSKIADVDHLFFPSKLTEFLHTIIVVPSQLTSIPDCFVSSKCSNVNVESRGQILMQDIISRLIAFIIRNFSSNRSVLSLGYRSKRWDSLSVLRNDNTTECHFVNTTHSYLLTSEWQQLADLLGEVAIRRILLRPVFMLLEEGNNCYVQISGEPVQDIVYKLPQYDVERGKVSQHPCLSHKRKRASKMTQGENVKKIKLNPQPPPQLTPSATTTSLNIISSSTVITSSTSPGVSGILDRSPINDQSLNLTATPVPVTKAAPTPLTTHSTPINLSSCHPSHIRSNNVAVTSPATSATPPTPTAVLPSKVTGRTVIGRHRMFYVHKIWMPLNRIFKTCDTDSLRKRIFPSSLLFIDGENNANAAIQSLNCFCEMLRKSELSCDVHHALLLTCLPLKETSLDEDEDEDGGVRKDKQCFDPAVLASRKEASVEDPAAAASGSHISTPVKKKKTKRGCRSGRQVKAKQRSMARRHSNLLLPNRDIGSKNTVSRARECLPEQAVASTPAAGGTVGHRLVARLLRAVRKERKLIGGRMGRWGDCDAEEGEAEAEGYITQESDSSSGTFSTGVTGEDRHESSRNSKQHPEGLTSKRMKRRRYSSVSVCQDQDGVIDCSEISSSTAVGSYERWSNSGHAFDVTSRNLPTKFSEDSSGNSSGMPCPQMELTTGNNDSQPDDEESSASNDTNKTSHTLPDSPGHINHDSEEEEEEIAEENPAERLPIPLPVAPTSSQDSLLRLACPRGRVKAFMTAIGRRLLPDHLVWGSRRNRSVFLAGIHSFVDLGRSSSLCLATVIKGLRTKEMPWLRLRLRRQDDSVADKDKYITGKSSQQQSDMQEPTAHKRKRKGKGGKEKCHPTNRDGTTPDSDSPVTDTAHSQSQQLLLELLHWIYEEVVIGLLGRVFYITEGEGSGTETLYYLRRDWKTVLELGGNKLSRQFVKVALPGSGNSNGNHTRMKQVVTRNIATTNFTTDTVILPAKPMTTTITPNVPLASAFTREMLTNRNIPTVRLLPKKSSVRPITNLGGRKRRRKDIANGSNSSNGKPPSTTCPPAAASLSCDIKNSAMYNCLHLLRRVVDERDRDSDRAGGGTGTLGFGVLGLNEVYQKFKQFRIKQGLITCSTSIMSGHQEPVGVAKSNMKISKADEVEKAPYYVAAFDLEKCFDNINTAKLYNLVRDLLQQHQHQHRPSSVSLQGGGGRPYSKGSKREAAVRLSKDRDRDMEEDSDNDRYFIHRYSLSHYVDSIDRPVVRTLRHVADTDDLIPFPAVVYPSISRRELLQLLKIHLFQHVVKLPSQDSLGEASYHTQITGIPQGSVLSPLLCNLYYGYAENKLFDLVSDSQLNRTKQKQEATTSTTSSSSSTSTPIASPLTSPPLPSFVVRLMDDYLVISENRVSFAMEVEVEGARVSLPAIEGRHLPWCGMLLNVDTLEVSPDWTRLLSVPLRWSYSVSATNKGQAFRRTIKYFFKSKCNAIFMDSGINSIQVVTGSVYRLFAITAMRMHCYVRDLHRSEGYIDMNFIATAVHDMIVFGARLIKASNQYCLTPKKFDLQRHKATSASSVNTQPSGRRDAATNMRRSNNNSSGTCTRNSIKVGDYKSIGSSDGRSMLNCTECELTYSQIVGLGLRACCTVLTQRSGYYRTVLRKLQLHLRHQGQGRRDTPQLSMSSSSVANETISQHNGNNTSSGPLIKNTSRGGFTTASEKYDLNADIFTSCYDINDLLKLKYWK